jgi:hypothetical protein
MTFTQCFFLVAPFCLAFCHVMFRYLDKWRDEDRMIARVLRVKYGEHRAVIQDDRGVPLMYLEDYEMPCRPVGRAR